MFNKIKLTSVCLVLFFLNNVFAAPEAPSECPPVEKIKNRNYVLRSTGDDLYCVKEGTDMDNFGTPYEWEIRIDAPIEAKSMIAANKLVDKLKSEASQPILLKDACVTMCYYLTKDTRYVFWLLNRND